MGRTRQRKKKTLRYVRTRWHESARTKPFFLCLHFGRGNSRRVLRPRGSQAAAQRRLSFGIVRCGAGVLLGTAAPPRCHSNPTRSEGRAIQGWPLLCPLPDGAPYGARARSKIRSGCVPLAGNNTAAAHSHSPCASRRIRYRKEGLYRSHPAAGPAARHPASAPDANHNTKHVYQSPIDHSSTTASPHAFRDDHHLRASVMLLTSAMSPRTGAACRRGRRRASPNPPLFF